MRLSEFLLVDPFVFALESEGLEINAIPEDGGPVLRVLKDDPHLGTLVVRRVVSTGPDEWYRESAVGNTIRDVFEKVAAQMPSAIIDKVQERLSTHMVAMRKSIARSGDVHFALNRELARRGPRT